MLKLVTSHGGRKGTNKSLDPGNKCITSKIVPDAIRSEANRKEKEKEENRRQKREKARIAVEKKGKAEEKRMKQKEKEKETAPKESQKNRTKGRKGRKRIKDLAEQACNILLRFLWQDVRQRRGAVG